FGVRTDRIPSEVHVSPRLGFTWAWGDGSDGPQTTFLRGGVGDFRSLTPTALYAAALSAPGLSSAQTQLICVGSAVPTPDWSLYAQDPSTIPTQCTDTATAVTLTPTPSVTAFAPDFAAPRARRASLALLHRFGSSNYWVTLEGNYARGVSQYGFRDSNLVTTPRFTLPAEAGRPNVQAWGTRELALRQALVGDVTLPVTRGLEVIAMGSFPSGAPFTPIVRSDINGSGEKNDGAFIFNPALTADTAIANGMQSL